MIYEVRSVTKVSCKPTAIPAVVRASEKGTILTAFLN